MRPNEVEQTRFGFAWGNTLVERITDGDRIGWVIRVWGRKNDGDLTMKFVDIRVSPNGQRIEVLA